MTAKILLLYFPVMIFKSLTSLLNSIYFARNRFLLAPALPVAGAVLSVGFFLSMQSALGVFAIPLSLALNTLLQFSVLFGVYVKENHYKFNIFLRHELFKKHLKLMIPLLIGGLITKSVFLVDRNIASTLGTGAISCIRLCNQSNECYASCWYWRIVSGLFSACFINYSKKRLAAFKAVKLPEC